MTPFATFACFGSLRWFWFGSPRAQGAHFDPPPPLFAPRPRREAPTNPRPLAPNPRREPPSYRVRITNAPNSIPVCAGTFGTLPTGRAFAVPVIGMLIVPPL